jgi:excisionase family DNA binding protein
MNNQVDRIAVSIDHAAKISGIGRTALYAAIKNGQLSAKKFGRRTLIAVDDLRAFVERLPFLKCQSGE